MMILLSVTVGALLVVVTVLQSTFPEDAVIKGHRFKIFAVSLAVTAGCLMIVTAFRDLAAKRADAAAQERLQSAVEGVSTTVFPRDVGIEISGRSVDDDAQISDIPISKESWQ